MLEKLDLLVRFWALSARLTAAKAPLSSDERRELLALLAEVGDAEIPAPGTVRRRERVAHLPLQLVAEGGFRRAELLRAGAGALVVSVGELLPVGAEVLVRAIDAIAGVEYVIPARVAWQAAGAPCTLALVVDGAPAKQPFALVPAVPPSLGFAPTRRMVG